jgi:SAM-dependent methyltransferase
VSRRLDSQAIANPWVHGTLIPIRGDRRDGLFVHEGEATPPGEGELPIPPPELLAGYTEAEYLRTGAQDVETMLEVLREAGVSVDDVRRVLELGSGSARMLRAFPRAPGSELWGVDLVSEQVLWCQDQLTPALRFATVTTVPHLPFEDGSFDLAYCGSVFTHIRELADAWLLELRRVVRPGGHIYVTIHDKHSVKLLLGDPHRFPDVPWFGDFAALMRDIDRRASISTRDWRLFWQGWDPYSQVFYDVDYVVRRWSAYCRVVAVREEAYQYQTALVLQK